MTNLDLYLMTNHDRFEFDESGNAHLTSKATPEAFDGFKKYKQQLIDKKILYKIKQCRNGDF